MARTLILVCFVCAEPAVAQKSRIDDGCASDANWPAISRKLDELAQIAQCSGTFTQSECRANLGLVAGGTAAVVAGAVGAKAAMRARRMPKLCGLRGVATSREFGAGNFVADLLAAAALPLAHAACVDPTQEMARHIRENFADAADEITEDVRRSGRERLAKEHPKLANNVDRQIALQREMNELRSPVKAADAERVRVRRNIMATDLKTLQDEAAQMIGKLKLTTDGGRTIRTTVSTLQNPAIKDLDAVYRDLFQARAGALDPSGLEKKSVVNSFLSRYQYDYQKSAASLRSIERLQTEIATKNVSAERLAAMIDELGEKVPSKQLGRLAGLRMTLTEKFKIPTAGPNSRLAREGFKLVGKGLAKAGGALLAVGTAAHAYAADPDSSRSFEDRLVTDLTGSTSVGCATRDSEWATVEGDGDCSYRPRWNAKTADFVLQPEATQREELRQHPQMCAMIAKVHADLSASHLSVTCRDHGAILSDNRRQFNTVIQYDDGGLVKRAVTTGKGKVSQYDLYFKNGQFEKLRVPSTKYFANVGKSVDFNDPEFSTTEINVRASVQKDEKAKALLQGTEEHFAMIQPEIQYAQACCAGVLDASDPRCAPMARGAGTSGASSVGRSTKR